MPYSRRTSIHGRRLALSSTGALVDANAYGALMKNSTGAIQSSSTLLTYVGEVEVAGHRIVAQSAVASSVASTLTNYGFQSLSSASATAMTAFEIAAPVAGTSKEIYIDTSASEFSLGGTATDVIFASTLVTANVSTLFASSAAAGGGLADTVIILRGISTTQWAIMGSTVNLAVG